MLDGALDSISAQAVPRCDSILQRAEMHDRRFIIGSLQALELKVEGALARTVATITNCARTILLLNILIALHGMLTGLRHIFLGVEAQSILTVGLAASSQTVLSR